MLLNTNMIKQMTGSGGGTLEAKNGESLLIRRIECIPSSNDTYLTLLVDRTAVGYYRVKGKSGNHLGTNRVGYLKRNIMEFLDQFGVNVSIPVESGQTFTIKRYAEAGNVMVIYDRYSEGDILASQPNGSECRELTFLQYAKIGVTPAASGYHLLDTPLTPSEFPDFPCGKPVPAGYQIDLLGIAACPFVNAEAGPKAVGTSYFKLIKDRTVLFDEDRNGIPFDGQNATATADSYGGNFSLIGSGTEILLNTNVISPGNPLMFEPAIKFNAGEELQAYLTLVFTSDPTWDSIEDVAFILKSTRI
jgi:hypothetical protein